MKKNILVILFVLFFILGQKNVWAIDFNFKMPEIENPLDNLSKTIESGIGKLGDTFSTSAIMNKLDLESGVNQITRQFVTNTVGDVEKKIGIDKTDENVRKTFNDAIKKIDNYLDLNLDEKSRAVLLKLRTIYKNGVDDINRSEAAKKPTPEPVDKTANVGVTTPWYSTKGGLLGKDASQKPLVGTVISKAIPYVYIAAGLSLLLVLISGGITLMTAAGNADKAKAGYGKISAGLIGFLIVFVSYFVVQIVQVLLGVKIF